VAVATSGCGSHQSTATRPADQTLKQCHQQWADVARSVKGLDQDTDPSALASRWTTVLATIDYYETSTTATGCQTNISSQVAAITSLREFSVKLRPYDMVYQLAQVAATVDSYQNAPLPKPVRTSGGDGKRKGKGKLVHPPTKAAVQAALATLQAHAAAADTALTPAWSEMASVELTNGTAVGSALQDLDFVAQDSTDWKQCEEALKVIVAAQHALAGETGTSGDLPDGTPSSTPGASPSATPIS
jgi:hypothetical protein